MRVWDIPVSQLCNKHLVAQHHEIHCIYGIITKNLKGFARHPEVMRWRRHYHALYIYHMDTVDEMKRRCFKHHSPMPAPAYTDGLIPWPPMWQPVEEQIKLLRGKGCSCIV